MNGNGTAAFAWAVFGPSSTESVFLGFWLARAGPNGNRIGEIGVGLP